MNAERWQKVDKVLQQALSEPPGNQDSFLREACAGDSELQREVESLLRHSREAGSFSQSPAAELLKEAAVDKLNRSLLSAGTRLGPYEVESFVGAGGMGEVYRARDTRLGRRVAVKVLPASFAADAGRLRRFELSRNAVERYRDGDVRKMAQELGAGSVVEGSVRADRQRVRIAVELVEARTEQTLWSEEYDRQIQDIFAVQSDVALRVAEALKTTLSPDERRRVERLPTQNVEAYELSPHAYATLIFWRGAAKRTGQFKWRTWR